MNQPIIETVTLNQDITLGSLCVIPDHKDGEEMRAHYIHKGNGLCPRHFKEQRDETPICTANCRTSNCVKARKEV